MLKVNVKTKGVRFTLPVPYAMLSMGVSLFASKRFQEQIHKWTKEEWDKNKWKFTLPVIDKELLKPIVKELKKYPGFVLVDVKAQDGTEVKIRL